MSGIQPRTKKYMVASYCFISEFSMLYSIAFKKKTSACGSHLDCSVVSGSSVQVGKSLTSLSILINN